jgi:glycosyltransferase involved in cell wall biosynthesis
MPHVYINARFLTQPVTGVQRFAIELSKALLSVSKDIQFSFLTPKNVLHTDLAAQFNTRSCGNLTGHAWEQLELPFYSQNSLLLNFCNTAPLVKRRQIVTVHDATYFAMPETFSASFRMWYQFLLPKLGRRSLAMTTVSTFSKQELIRYNVASEHRISVISPSGEHIKKYPSDTGVFRKHQLTRPFVLAVSSQSPNKNFAALAASLAHLPGRSFDVVIAGGRHPSFANVSSLGMVKQVGYVSNEELKALYEHASCFVYPSLYEGFGLPPLEAMACGCPVIVSNAASLPEVCGDAALYVDPHDPKTIAAQLEHLVSNESLQRELRQKGLERAKQFSWEKGANETLEVIQNLL